MAGAKQLKRKLISDTPEDLALDSSTVHVVTKLLGNEHKSKDASASALWMAGFATLAEIASDLMGWDILNFLPSLEDIKKFVGMAPDNAASADTTPVPGVDSRKPVLLCAFCSPCA